MSAKTGAQAGRRTPLSLSGSVKQSAKSTGNTVVPSNGANSNANGKADKGVQRSSDAQQSSNEFRETAQKKTQNGLGKNAVPSSKDKQQSNGSTYIPNKEVAKEKRLDLKIKLDKIDEQKFVKDTAQRESERKTQRQNLETNLEEKVEKSKTFKAEVQKNATTEMRVTNASDKIQIEKVTPQTKSVEKAVSTTPTKASGAKTAIPKTPTQKAAKPILLSPKTTEPVASQPIPSLASATAMAIVEDVEMIPLCVEPSPIKPKAPAKDTVPVVTTSPKATSTPGKAISKRASSKTDIQLAMENEKSHEPINCARTFNQISGRRSIRHEYTPSRFQSNPQFRESYRRINNELDVSSLTNTSLNVTVGSEIPNTSAFSIFGFGRKRERTPPHSQSAIELQTDGPLSPPKRARLEGFFNVVSSPITLLRSRFAKTSIQNSSTPVKLHAAQDADDDVQNVSGVSIEEEIPDADTSKDVSVTEEPSLAKEALADAQINSAATAETVDEIVKIVGDETEGIDLKTDAPVVSEHLAKNKRCILM